MRSNVPCSPPAVGIKWPTPSTIADSTQLCIPPYAGSDFARSICAVRSSTGTDGCAAAAAAASAALSSVDKALNSGLQRNVPMHIFQAAERHQRHQRRSMVILKSGTAHVRTHKRTLNKHTQKSSSGGVAMAREKEGAAGRVRVRVHGCHRRNRVHRFRAAKHLSRIEIFRMAQCTSNNVLPTVSRSLSVCVAARNVSTLSHLSYADPHRSVASLSGMTLGVQYEQRELEKQKSRIRAADD